MDKDILFYSLSNYGEFGMKRFSCTLLAGEKRRIPLLVPSGRRWVVFKYRFGDIAVDVFNFRFNGVRNYFEQEILIGTELINFIVEPKPYIVVSGHDGEIVIHNTDTVSRDFSIVLDFYLLDDEIQGRIREFILGSREEFRGKVTKQAGTGGA